MTKPKAVFLGESTAMIKNKPTIETYRTCYKLITIENEIQTHEKKNQMLATTI